MKLTESIQSKFGDSKDICIRQVYVHENKSLEMTLIFVDGLVDEKNINQYLLKPLSQSKAFNNVITIDEVFDCIKEGALYSSKIEVKSDINEILHAILSGNTALVFDSLKKTIIFSTVGFDKRTVSPPIEESTFGSPKDSFVETIRTNTGLLRRRIKSSDLTVEEIILGKESKTTISILYMDNICNDEFVKLVRERLSSIDQDRVMNNTDIVPYLDNRKLTLFPLTKSTEKPDLAAASLLDGKVIVLMDGMPYAVMLPATMADFFQISGDYQVNRAIGPFIRIIRYMLFLVSITVPAFYIAIIKFHNEMIPASLAKSIATSTAGMPFPITLEVILMSYAFYSLIQASLSMSKTFGGSISIVGGLVLGEAAITAKLISPAVIVIVATAAIASLASPNELIGTAWLFQIFFIILSGLYGLFGVTSGLILFLAHLASLESLGVPYLAPFAGTKHLQLGDSLLRIPHRFLNKRPLYLHPKNKRKKRNKRKTG
jgi:spore germination protein KA